MDWLTVIFIVKKLNEPYSVSVDLSKPCENTLHQVLGFGSIQTQPIRSICSLQSNTSTSISYSFSHAVQHLVRQNLLKNEFECSHCFLIDRLNVWCMTGYNHIIATLDKKDCIWQIVLSIVRGISCVTQLIGPFSPSNNFALGDLTVTQLVTSFHVLWNRSQLAHCSMVTGRFIAPGLLVSVPPNSTLADFTILLTSALSSFVVKHSPFDWDVTNN